MRRTGPELDFFAPAALYGDLPRALHSDYFTRLEYGQPCTPYFLTSADSQKQRAHRKTRSTVNLSSTAGLTLKIFNYEFLCFHTERSLQEDTRSSILKELDNQLLQRDFDYSQHELLEHNLCEEFCRSEHARDGRER
ncbi:hypothetical protein D9M71_724620 [compost metagenome]